MKITDSQNLAICNLVSRGVSMADAKKQILTKKVQPVSKGGEKPKVSASDKKDAMTLELEALGAEVPANGASVAVFAEALTRAKADAAKAEGGADDLM